ncbi:hypothetical protein MLD38_034144 [Melastoma candidum]|uniref:Uncharacterized protein n=1 Tax=Melastoma candidum TaxID=119954 RepID=A0ACB9MDA8_9MYRT|nr:hypothetical protein MLD38_034144 [Melastoma candidum]
MPAECNEADVLEVDAAILIWKGLSRGRPKVYDCGFSGGQMVKFRSQISLTSNAFTKKILEVSNKDITLGNGRCQAFGTSHRSSWILHGSETSSSMSSCLTGI